MRRGLESELRNRGVSLVEAGAADEIHVTLSQNFAGYLLVAEVKRGEERQVILLPLDARRGCGPRRSAGGVGREDAHRVPGRADSGRGEDRLRPAAAAAGAVTRLRGGERTLGSAGSGAFGPLLLPRDARGRLMVEGGSVPGVSARRDLQRRGGAARRPLPRGGRSLAAGARSRCGPIWRAAGITSTAA